MSFDKGLLGLGLLLAGVFLAAAVLDDVWKGEDEEPEDGEAEGA